MKEIIELHEYGTIDNYEFLFFELEKYISIKMYKYVYPQEKSYKDLAFYLTCKMHSWIKPDHLDIPQQFYNQQIYQFSINALQKVGSVKSTVEKIYLINYSLQVIENLFQLMSNGKSQSNTDSLLNIFLYLIIKAGPTSFITDINFIKIFDKGDNNMNQFIITNSSYAIDFIFNMKPNHFKIQKQEFDRLVYQQEKSSDLLFYQQRNRGERKIIVLKQKNSD